MSDNGAIEALKQLVHDALAPEMDGREFEVSVYAFGEDMLRISEVDHSTKGDPDRGDKFLVSGGGWMRSDLDSAAVILSCEDFLLSYGEEPMVYAGFVNEMYDPMIVDLAQEAEQNVRATISGKPSAVPWEWRWPTSVKVSDSTVWYDPEKKAAYDRAMQK